MIDRLRRDYSATVKTKPAQRLASELDGAHCLPSAVISALIGCATARRVVARAISSQRRVARRTIGHGSLAPSDLNAEDIRFLRDCIESESIATEDLPEAWREPDEADSDDSDEE